MNDTLDRLKALNSMLEEKLSEKKQKAGITGRSDDSRKEKKAPEKGEKKTYPSKESAVENAAEEENTRKQAEILLEHLSINADAEPVRARNLEQLSRLFRKLEIEKKVPDIRDIFIYKAMNISGIGLKEEDFGEIREGKYVQVIAITYEPDKNGKKKAKNISLGYFGKAEALEIGRKNEIIEFVLRWRYEKAFQNLEHYRILLERIRPADRLF